MGIDDFTTPIFNASKYASEGVWGISQYATDISGGYYGIQWVLLTFMLVFGFTTKLYGFKRGSLVSFFITNFITAFLGIKDVVNPEIVIIMITLHTLVTAAIFIIEWRSDKT